MTEENKSNRQLQILAVDDEKDITDFISEALSEHGFSVRTASSGNEALASVQSEAPDLLLLDIILPDIDGIAVYEMLRKDKSLKVIPVIFFSTLAKNLPTMFTRRMRGVPYAVIAKPVDVNVLLATIEKLLIQGLV